MFILPVPANPNNAEALSDLNRDDVVDDHSATGKLVSDPIAPPENSNKNTKIEILGITVSQVVTIVGTPSYTSGAQLWNGAAATLNRNPTPIISAPNTIPCVIFSCPFPSHPDL